MARAVETKIGKEILVAEGADGLSGRDRHAARGRESRKLGRVSRQPPMQFHKQAPARMPPHALMGEGRPFQELPVVDAFVGTLADIAGLSQQRRSGKDVGMIHQDIDVPGMLDADIAIGEDRQRRALDEGKLDTGRVEKLLQAKGFGGLQQAEAGIGRGACVQGGFDRLRNGLLNASQAVGDQPLDSLTVRDPTSFGQSMPADIVCAIASARLGEGGQMQHAATRRNSAESEVVLRHLWRLPVPSPGGTRAQRRWPWFTG
ncbi:MAG: hypothetical protein WDM86_15805 [Rhizomicrobium sp.]